MSHERDKLHGKTVKRQQMTANYIEPTNCKCSKLVAKYLVKWKIDFSCPPSPRFVIEPILKNYRPVSNLQFIFKLTESVVNKFSIASA